MLIVSCAIPTGFGQAIIQNSDKPGNKKAGRTVLLKEVMRIRDDGTHAVFKQPQNLLISQNGSIHFLDYLESSHLYKFSKSGQFIFKILRRGQGPEQCQWASSFIIQGDRIRIQSWNPPKAMDFDFKGRYIGEIKTGDTHGLWFLASIDDKIYGVQDKIPHSEAIHKEGIIESPYRLYAISDDFQNWTALFDFPVEHYIKKARWIRRGMVAAAVYQHFLFMVHTAEYRIVKFDTRKAAVDRIITRQYKRQKIPGRETGLGINEREFRGLRPPPSKYYFDILGIYIVRDTLWVLTSTPGLDDSKRLIDVFDMDGVYSDSFYLQFPDNGLRHSLGSRNSCFTDDGYLFVFEQDGDGYVSLGKYKIHRFD